MRWPSSHWPRASCGHQSSPTDPTPYFCSPPGISCSRLPARSSSRTLSFSVFSLSFTSLLSSFFRFHSLLLSCLLCDPPSVAVCNGVFVFFNFIPEAAFLLFVFVLSVCLFFFLLFSFSFHLLSPPIFSLSKDEE